MDGFGHGLGNLLRYEPTFADGLSVSFRLRRARVSVRPLTSHAIKISVRFDSPRHALAESARPYALLQAPWPGAALHVEEREDDIVVHVGALTLRAEREPFRLSYYGPDGQELLSEVDGGGIRHDYWEQSLHFRLPADEAFFGFGEADQSAGRAGTASAGEPAVSAVPLDHRGAVLPICHVHQPPSRVILPMFLSSRHYGLLIDNPLPARWDLGASDPARFSYIASGGYLDFVVFAGENLLDLLRVYSGLTGRSPLPPLWSLGYLQSRYGYRDEEELLALARRLRQEEIPCDGLILDVHWFDQMGDLRFAPSRWPDPAATVEQLKRDGFHLTLIEEPYLTEHSRLYPEARAAGFLARRPDGSPYLFDTWMGRVALADFTNPAARRWWAKEHQPLVEMGIDGHWLDLVEPMEQPIDMVHHAGPSAIVHNRFADQMVESVVDAWQAYAPGRRPFIMTRAGFAGLQRTGLCLWSGDVEASWEALATQVALGQNAGLAGFPAWSSDTGGFGHLHMQPEHLGHNEEYGQLLDTTEEAELFVRWLQFSAFSPVCRVHNDQFRRREPWSFGPQVEEIVRTYLQLRYRLLPYIYSCYYEAYRAGTPVMRPLMLHHEDDPVTRTLTDQYLFGPSILAAPVLAAGAAKRSVYLPADAWYNGWTEELIQGPGWFEVDAPLERLPLFIRAGSLIPFGPRRQSLDRPRLDPLAIHFYAGQQTGNEAEFTLYEDDGETTRYRQGEYCRRRMQASREGAGWTIRLDECEGRGAAEPAGRPLLCWLHGMGRVGSIQRDDRPLPALASREAWRKVKAGWFHDEGRDVVGLKIQATTGPVVLHVGPGRQRKPEE